MRKILLPAFFVVAVACSQAGVRPESNPLPATDLQHLEVDVAAQRDASGAWTVVASLSRPGDTADHCFVAPPGTTVTVDKQVLLLGFAGGPAKPGDVSGVPVAALPCAAATFTTPQGVHFAEAAESRVQVAMREAEGEAIFAKLFGERHWSAMPAGPFRPGDQVTLTSDAADDWRGSTISSEVAVFGAAGALRTVGQAQGLTVKPESCSLSFAFPELAPGPARVEVYLRDVQARARPVACRGLHACLAGPAPSAPLAVDVVAR